jgi:hypothetical protein
MLEFVFVAIIMVAVAMIGQVRRARRTGQTQFRLPTPKSWQLPGPGEATGSQPRQVIQPMPGTPPYKPQVYQPLQGNPQVVRPVHGFVPPTFAPQPGTVWPSQQPRPSHRPPQHQLPAPQGDLDERVRELMSNNMEVAAVRMLCDEAEMGIIEAQAYARSLVAPEQQTTTTEPAEEPSAAEERYSGSAAFGTSTFERDDEDVWPSGWVDKPQRDDRSDIDELWNTVRNAGRPQSQA